MHSKRSFLVSTITVPAAFWLSTQPCFAQFVSPDLQNAATLDAAVKLLNAGTAQRSTHLLLDLPDVALPGTIQARLTSRLRGTSSLVLLRGSFSPNPQAANMQPAPAFAPKVLGERPPTPPPPIWVASTAFKSGAQPDFTTPLLIDRTETFTLFAQAQGKWWYTTREVKVGAKSKRP